MLDEPPSSSPYGYEYPYPAQQRPGPRSPGEQDRAAPSDHAIGARMSRDPLEAGLLAPPDPDEDPLILRRRLEDAAQAAGALQAALLDLETELQRLQQIVRRASPAMMQLMQAATEVRAAELRGR